MSSARRTPRHPTPLSQSLSSSPSPPPLNPTSPSSSSSSTTTATHHFPPMSDEDDGVLPPTSTNTSPTTPPSPSPSPSPSPPPPPTSTDLQSLPPPPHSSTTSAKATSFPIREDCWSEDATHTLIEVWGSHYLDLNRGNLRQKHWQEVADAVNGVHAHTKKLHRTDIQCKNRIDTLKKKYKVEKSKVLQSYVSTWPFFRSLDSLIGDSFIKAHAPPSGTPPMTRKNSLAAKNTPSPAPAPSPSLATVAVRKEFPVLPPLPSAIPVGPRSKRPAPAAGTGNEAVFRRNFSAMAAAAAAVAENDEDEDESDTSSAAGMGLGAGGMRRKKRIALGNVAAEGYRKLVEAIGGFAEIYERVEEAKQRQMVELEKQRMQFAKDLEIQRMKLFMESQVQLEKLKRSKHNSQSDGYL